jgi:hypothetical protein
MINKEKFIIILKNILPIETKYMGTWSKIEQMLTSIIRVNKENFDQFFDVIIQGSNKEFIELLVKDSFQSLEYSLGTELSNRTFSRYIFSDVEPYRQVALELLRKVEKIDSIISEINPTEQILSLLISEFSRSVLLSKSTSKFFILLEPYYRIAEEKLKTEFIREMTFQAVNYPEACLIEWKKIESKSEIFISVINKADKYFSDIRETRDLSAISYSRFEFIRGAELERKVLSRNLDKQVKEKSIFLSLIKATQILYGDSWTFPGDVRGTAPNKFNEVSYTAEYPRLESIDPEGMVLRRMFINSRIKNVE